MVFLKTKPGGATENFKKGDGRANMVRCGILHDHTSVQAQK